MTTPDGAAAHLVAEPLQQIQARFDTGSEEAHGVRCGCRALAPRVTTPLPAGTTNTTDSNTAGYQ
jgi:hypothetical protein